MNACVFTACPPRSWQLNHPSPCILPKHQPSTFPLRKRQTQARVLSNLIIWGPQWPLPPAVLNYGREFPDKALCARFEHKCKLCAVRTWSAPSVATHHISAPGACMSSITHGSDASQLSCKCAVFQCLPEPPEMCACDRPDVVVRLTHLFNRSMRNVERPRFIRLDAREASRRIVQPSSGGRSLRPLAPSICPNSSKHGHMTCTCFAQTS